MNAFNVEMIKGFTRTTSANRVSAVQMIASGSSGSECKANAYAAFTTTMELVGVDKGTVSIYKALSEMPESVWGKFPKAYQESQEGVKQANALVRLAQAFMLCGDAGVGFKDGFKDGYKEGYIEGMTDRIADSKADSVEDSAADSVADSEA